MLFSSHTFLFYFLPCCICFYYIAKKKYRNYILLVFSLFFYAWGEPVYVLLMLFSVGMNYLFALLAHTFRERERTARLFIVLAVVMNILVIGYYKYSAFLVKNINLFFGINIPEKNLTLPIGISFYTFQALSYVIDVWRGNGRVQKNPVNVCLYIAFFPQLIAGPILRYEDMAGQLEHRKESIGLFYQGIKRFLYGLGKKMILSNTLALIADTAFLMDSRLLTIGFAWLGAAAYTMQIYFDFSGYSDMAIGLGKMFGFHFPENFNYPYMSGSITEFWQRWHISLGSWFRDYVYIPLGGNRGGAGRQLINLFVVWSLTGLWHGADWTFLVWGIYYFVLLTGEKFCWTGITKLHVLKHVYTVGTVIIGWVLFRSDTIADAWMYVKTMFGLGASKTIYNYQLGYYLYEYRSYLILGLLACMPWKKSAFVKNRAGNMGMQFLEAAFLSIQIIVCISLLISDSYNPFIYFNF